MSEHKFDVIVIGGGAAGLFCAATAGKRGRRVLIIEHSEKLGKKILISGGGRCNFTNIGASPKNYISENTHFCISALARYTPADFIRLAERHNIAYHEKKSGQLFCNGSAKQIVKMLTDECKIANVEIRTNSNIQKIEKKGERYICSAFNNDFSCESLIIATGGMSIPAMGATDFAYRIALQFGLKTVEPRPALTPLLFGASEQDFAMLSGVSAEAVVSNARASFRESVLFTHRGLSGPAILQISSYWHDGESIRLNLLPDIAENGFLNEREISKFDIKNALAGYIPKRLSELFCERTEFKGNVASLSAASRLKLYSTVTQWKIAPESRAGFDKAEVTAGGVDTRELSSKTMECRAVKGLYFIGEAVDVTGWLGGYNFQWAWSSGFAAGTVC
ncbi:NAD(P)/FAD-dependent oxidoreductase [Ignavibacteria bacterium]|nr:NAD(P)/FAD-dependent oxidoreductase [Bacteroidota bacterium]MCZ2132719.1 NAD(P)/FAD-dependent oxidoreductase [Bacteroidota bacterium]